MGRLDIFLIASLSCRELSISYWWSISTTPCTETVHCWGSEARRRDQLDEAKRVQEGAGRRKAQAESDLTGFEIAEIDFG